MAILTGKIHWKPGSTFRVVEAEDVHKELESIRRKQNGDLKPEDVVERARSKRSKMHPLFEWDDSVAAHEYRLHTARKIIGSIAIEPAECPKAKTRVYETTVIKETRPDRENTSRKVYRPFQELLKDPDERQILLARALRELVAWQVRYRTLQELAVVFRAINELEGIEV